MANGRAGAPKGGRVHWLLWNLTSELKRAYVVRFDYENHNYALIRYPERNERRNPIDEFIVIRTSECCWRIMYYHFEQSYFEYVSAKTSNEAVKLMQSIFERMSGESETTK